ncbi:GIN domain-containing protein [Sphingomonas mesophila]|uniref:GIN domain-containing protein n=1 Tax=Sphingomonas mesophila TaxID=2303576 RepID=UPI000E5884FA|nr:DUF2807 domain-containing protein [Sphingomonas mesophila]
MRLMLTIPLLLAAAAPAAAADRNFGVNGFDRVRVDGDYRVELTTGVAPYAKASGDVRAIDRLNIKVEGRTLIVRLAQSGGWGSERQSSGPVTIRIGTHELTTAQVNGAGSLAINRVEGLKFEASAAGAGMLTIADVAVDQLTVVLAGAASARLAGKAGRVTALVRGMSVLDAGQLEVKDSKIVAEGPATVRLTASETAKVTAAGVGSVSLAGNPACTLDVHGSASVSGCRAARY